MDLRKKIEMACTYAGISQATLARALEVTPATFNSRLKVCKFSPEELSKIAEVLGGKYVFGFEFPDGTKI
ncbi:MAG: helix-turn-helix transcriptional regulator [Clostridia bacterium]|nr:helix-turn-helix transcriptional regulator [Clostridia bacterium]